MNLLKNPEFAFHVFENHRSGRRESFASGNIAFWNTDAWGDIQVIRAGHADAAARPDFAVDNLVEIRPGKRLLQFFTLPEAGLAHGDHVSLLAHGCQTAPNTLQVRLRLLKLDSAEGEWQPRDFGLADQRTFPRQSRGELVTAALYETAVSVTGHVVLRIEDAVIPGNFQPDARQGSSVAVNTVGIQVEFANISTGDTVWVYAPALVRGAAAPAPRQVWPGARAMRPIYRHIPRTMQKLWKGEPLHIILMGSSIDRGSANPPLYPYNENPDAPEFKQPLADNHAFDPDMVGRPDLAGYVGWWQHYWGFAGRLRLELMRKFNLPVEKLLLNIMACDGSCVGEAHAGLADYCRLALPPDPGMNGNGAGRTWAELYPDLCARPEGTRPDLVIFGSGANEKTDTPEEVAVFEGAIRWIQRNYPETEFLFCMFQNYGQYTPNTGDLQALALRYQIPVLDYGLLADNLMRCCNRYALVPADGHPQAAAHFLWFKTLEKAFECWDPTEAGQAQLQLPERLHPNAYGWEGELATFTAPHPRIKGPRLIIEDTVFNLWCQAEEKLRFKVDGVWRSGSRGRSMKQRDLRNSTFVHGNLALGDRHLVEAFGTNPVIIAADCKICPDRRFIGAESALWERGGLTPVPFASEWGAPYGAMQIVLPPGAALELEAVGTDISVAYVDRPDAGILLAAVDGVEKLRQTANQPFEDSDGAKIFIENRRGIRGLPFGVHLLRLEAIEAPVSILGAFVYDSRSNRRAERRLAGRAAPGDTVALTPPFKARPLVVCQGGLAAAPADIAAGSVTFSGSASGAYEIIGE